METYVDDTGRHDEVHWPADCPSYFRSCYDGADRYPASVDPIGGCRTNFTYDPGPHPSAGEKDETPPILTTNYPACVGNMMYDTHRPPERTGAKVSSLAEFAARIACVTAGACETASAADESVIVPVRPAAREE